jgi:hypothetical protein
MSNEERNADGADFAALLDFLHETPNTLARLIDGLSLAELRFRNSEVEFSALENLCHLRDLELQATRREFAACLTKAIRCSLISMARA